MMGAFLRACERNLAPLKPLYEANVVAFRAALVFFRRERGKGERAADVSTFFKKKGLVPEFEQFLRHAGKGFRQKLDRKWGRFDALLVALDEQRLRSKSGWAA
ncbi:MAG: hypothetical protein WA383_21305 [Terriglobales bacterium]|jgi:hypothetical protein